MTSTIQHKLFRKLSNNLLDRTGYYYAKRIINNLSENGESHLLRCNHAGQEWLESNNLRISSILEATSDKTFYAVFLVDIVGELKLINLLNMNIIYDVITEQSKFKINKTLTQNEIEELLTEWRE
jgi:hypothetical protein